MAATDDLVRDRELVADAHDRLVERLRSLVGCGGLDAGGASRLPGWTRGHVLTHLARNADGLRGLVEAAERGEEADQYPGGAERRTRDIEAGAGRAADELVDDVATSASRLEAAWAGTDGAGTGRVASGTLPMTDVAFHRLREVWLHAVDLDVGFEPADLDATYVRLELRRMEMRWAARRPMGMTPLPEAVLALDPPLRVAWFAGRRELDGVAPAGLL